MDPKNIQKLSEEYKQQLEKLDSETLEIIYNDHSKALEYAKKGIEMIEPEKLSDKYINELAYEMQAVAKMVLTER